MPDSSAEPSVRYLHAVVVVRDRVVLAQRISLPVVRQKDTTEIRMTVEADAVHVVPFTLVPVGRAPDLCHRGNMRVLDRGVYPQRTRMNRLPLLPHRLQRRHVVDHAELSLVLLPL